MGWRDSKPVRLVEDLRTAHGLIVGAAGLVATSVGVILNAPPVATAMLVVAAVLVCVAAYLVKPRPVVLTVRPEGHSGRWVTGSDPRKVELAGWFTITNNQDRPLRLLRARLGDNEGTVKLSGPEGWAMENPFIVEIAPGATADVEVIFVVHGEGDSDRVAPPDISGRVAVIDQNNHAYSARLTFRGHKGS